MPQITNQHADSLSRIVKLMKLIIVKRNETQRSVVVGIL